MAMSASKWLMNKFRDINRDRMKKHIDLIHERSGKSRAYIRFDIFLNFLTRGAGYTDYFRGDYINLTRKEKDTFATARKFYRLIAYMNDEQYSIIMHDKLLFDELFKDYLKREFINLRNCTAEEFKAFLDGKEIVFAKESIGEGGHGISKIRVDEIKDAAALREQLIGNGQLLVEEAIIQHEDLNRVNPYVVNSFRIVTVYKDGRAKAISNAMRINQDDAEVIGCTNDLYFSLGADGRINSNVVDDYGNVYETHPMTGMRFDEVLIHDVDKAFKMCEEAALRIPQVRYVGWDVAFSVNGPVMVEGNEYPGYGILQHYRLKDSRTGHLKEIADYLGDEFDNIRL